MHASRYGDDELLGSGSSGEATYRLQQLDDSG